MALSVLDPSLYWKTKLNPSADQPLETIYEVTSYLPRHDWAVAYADIVESVRHVHHHTRETYVHLEGPPLIVFLGDEERRLEIGDSLDIPLNTPHKARTTGSDPARILVTTCPAWTAEDHHLLE